MAGHSSINIVSDEDVIAAEGDILKGMKHLGLTGTKESADAVGATTSKRTIFQIPKHICAGRDELFRPQIVSIGPYSRHNDGGHENKELLGMEVVKQQFLNDLIAKTSPAFLTACLQKLKEQESKIRSCYYKSFEGMGSDVFIKMMLLDGIFIIQYFMKWKRNDIHSTIGHVQWNLSMVKNDLLMLENQIPFFVLQDLFDLFVTSDNSGDAGSNKDVQLRDVILGGFQAQGELTETISIKPDVSAIKHLLHLYHCWYTQKKEPAKGETAGSYCRKIYEPAKSVASYLRHFLTRVMTCCKRFTQSTAPASAPRAPASILSATKLHEAGIKFKKNKSPASFLDVTFDEIKGQLKIPPFVIDDMTTYKFANLITLEQSANSDDVPYVITSYAAFMDKVIDTSSDVEILRHKGILQNMLASNDEVANFFNQLCRYSHLNVENHALSKVFKDVDAYSRTRLHRERARFVRSYFSSGLALTGLVSAAFLLVLTLLQTYFTLYAYYRPKSAS